MRTRLRHPPLFRLYLPAPFPSGSASRATEREKGNNSDLLGLLSEGEAAKYFRDVTWHRERIRFSRRVEANCEPNVCASSPIDFYIVEELEGCDEVVGPGDGGILDPEVVDYKGEDCSVGVVAE
jgi:hypothetical protein